MERLVYSKGVSILSESWAKPGIASLRVTIDPLLDDLFSLTAFCSCSCFHSRSVCLSVCLLAVLSSVCYIH